MARVHGKDLSSLQVDDSGGTARNLLADTVSLSPKYTVQTHDTTTLGDDAMEFTSGLKYGDEFDHELFYNNAAASSWLVATGRLGVEGTFAYSDGTRTVSMETIVTAVSDPISVGDMRKITVSHKITGDVTFS